MGDSQISPMDIYYLEDQDLVRQLVELGYRGSGETLKREEFEARKRAAEEAKASKLEMRRRNSQVLTRTCRTFRFCTTSPSERTWCAMVNSPQSSSYATRIPRGRRFRGT